MRITVDSFNNIKLIGFYLSIIFFVACTGTVTTPDPTNTEDIESFNRRLNKHKEKIEGIEQQLISYQTIINNHSQINLHQNSMLLLILFYCDVPNLWNQQPCENINQV